MPGAVIGKLLQKYYAEIGLRLMGLYGYNGDGNYAINCMQPLREPIMSIKLTSDQTATAVAALNVYNKASNAIAKASVSQGTSGVDYITVVSPAIISIYKEMSQDGALIGKRTVEAADMTTAISELLATTGLKPQHSLSKRTISF